MNQNGGIHKGGFAVLCHRNGGSESPGILIPVAISAFDYGEYISLQDAFLYFECATIRIIIDCRDVGAFLSGKTYAQLDQDDAKRVIFEIWNSRKSEETNIADTILEQNEGATIVFRRSKKSSKKQQRNS